MNLSSVYHLEEIVVARLYPGDSLIDGIKNIAQEHGVKTGVILSVIGTTQQLVLRNPKPGLKLPITDETEQSTQTDTYSVERPLEIITAEGIISEKDDQIDVHLHICCSQDGGRAYTGHLFRATVWTQAEVVIGKLKGSPLRRKFDKITGLYQLDVGKKGGER